MTVPDDSKDLPKSYVLHLIYLTFAYVSDECSFFIHLLGARLAPDAVSQSSIQSDCAYMSLVLSWMHTRSILAYVMEK